MNSDSYNLSHPVSHLSPNQTNQPILQRHNDNTRYHTLINLFLPFNNNDYKPDENDEIEENKYKILEIYLTDEILEKCVNLTFCDITHKKIKVMKIKNIDKDEITDLYLYLGFGNEIFETVFIDFKHNISEYDENIINKNDILITLKFYHTFLGLPIERFNLRNTLQLFNIRQKENESNDIYNDYDRRSNRELTFNLIFDNYNVYCHNSLIYNNPNYFCDNTIDVISNNNFENFEEISKQCYDIMSNYILNHSIISEEVSRAIDNYIKNYEMLICCYKDKNFCIQYESKLFSYIDKDMLKSFSDDSVIYDEHLSLILNDPIKYLDMQLQEYKKSLEEDYVKDVLPDIYMLCGATAFPDHYERKLNNSAKIIYKQTCRKLINFSDVFFYFFKQAPFWYYINLIVCFSAQILAPIYYIYDYNENHASFCPNLSKTPLKFLGVIFFLTLYSQYSDLQDKIFQTQFKYSQTFFIKNKYCLILSFLVNQSVTFLIPIVTYILFLDDPTILGFILNCMTALFLVELDNMMAIATCGSNLMNMFVNDYMILEFVSNGIKENNFIKNLYSNPFVSSTVTLSSMCQIGLMFFLSLQIGFCL